MAAQKRDENEQLFEPAWMTPQYPKYDNSESGVWRLVKGDAGNNVGVMWLSEDGSTGVSWVTQTPNMDKLYRHFVSAARAGTPAGFAYLIAQDLPGIEFAPESHGRMTGIEDEITQMMAEIDEAYTT